jgi:hypothetical protein
MLHVQAREQRAMFVDVQTVAVAEPRESLVAALSGRIWRKCRDLLFHRLSDDAKLTRRLHVFGFLVGKRLRGAENSTPWILRGTHSHSGVEFTFTPPLLSETPMGENAGADAKVPDEKPRSQFRRETTSSTIERVKPKKPAPMLTAHSEAGLLSSSIAIERHRAAHEDTAALLATPRDPDP